MVVANVRNSKNLRAAAITLAVAGIGAAWSSVALSGTKTGVALAGLLTAGPALLYAALVAPLAFPFGLFVLFTPLDEVLTIPAFGTVSRILGIATAFALFLYMLRTKKFIDPSRWMASWLMLYLWMGASLLWATDIARSTELLMTALQLLGLYVVLSMFPITTRQLQAVLYAVIAGGVIAAFYAIYLYANGVSVANRMTISGDSNGDPNHFGASLVVPMAMAVFLGLWTRRLWAKVALFATAGVLAAAITLSGSRGAMIGVLVLIIFLLIRDPHRRVLVGFAGLLGVIGGLFAGQSIAGRFAAALGNGGAGRADIWHVGWIAFTQNWLVGAGYENFSDAYDKAYITVFQPFYTNWHRAPHNLLLGTGVELGIIGLGLILLAWFGQFKMLSFIGPDDERYGLRLALQGCVLAMFTVAMFSDIMVRKYVWLLFILIALTRNARSDSPKHA